MPRRHPGRPKCENAIKHLTMEEAAEKIARRATAIANRLGMYLAREIDCQADDWKPTEDFINRFGKYTRAVVEIRNSQRLYEVELRKRTEHISDDAIVSELNEIMGGEAVFSVENGRVQRANGNGRAN